MNGAICKSMFTYIKFYIYRKRVHDIKKTYGDRQFCIYKVKILVNWFSNYSCTGNLMI